jgi:hypothetical protein
VGEVHPRVSGRLRPGYNNGKEKIVISSNSNAGVSPRPVAIVLLAVTVAGAALAGSARATEAGKEVPFKGHSSGTVTTTGFDPATGTAFTHVDGEGRATHLGHFTVTGHVEVDVATGVPHGTWTLTAANGDQLFLDMGGSGIDDHHGFGAFTVTGGTGRFEGASGYYEHLITFAVPLGTADVINYSDVLEGTISTSGHERRP